MSQPSLAVPRLVALDLARGLAVLFMVWVHVLEEWAQLSVQRATFGRVVEFFGSSPAAPVFMVLMGASVAFSRRSAPRALAWRGLQLLGLGYLLNLLRGTLPAQIGLSAGLVRPEELGVYTPWNLFWVIDILGFAGPALALLGLARLTQRSWVWLALAAACASVGPWLWGLTTGVTVVDGVLRHLWGTGPLVSFPLFPWLAYPLVGMAWGTWLARAEDEARFFRRTALAGAALLLAGTGFLVEHGRQLLGDHWRVGPGGVAWILGFVALWLCLCRLLTRAVPDNFFFRRLRFWSRNVTRFYLVQWFIIAWGTGIAGHHALGVGWTVVCQLLVVVLAHGVTSLWVRRRERRAREVAS